MITLGLLPTNLAFGGLLLLPLCTRSLLGMARLPWWSRYSASWTSEMAKCSRMCTQWSWMARHCLSKMVRAAGVGYAGERWRSDTTPATVVTLSSCVSVADTFDLAFCNMSLMFFPEPDKGMQEMRRVLVPGGRACVQIHSRVVVVGMCSSFVAWLGRSNVQVHLKLGQIGT